MRLLPPRTPVEHRVLGSRGSWGVRLIGSGLGLKVISTKLVKRCIGSCKVEFGLDKVFHRMLAWGPYWCWGIRQWHKHLM